MFQELGLHRIEANIMPKNKRSLRVVEKLGFYNEGLAYKYLKINGKWEDHIHMVLLNDKV
jgi:[ribosomal protein S5]-alanine N-acetyltransferase